MPRPESALLVEGRKAKHREHARMNAAEPALLFEQAVLLLGGARVSSELLLPALSMAGPLVAADGGANQLLGSEVIPDAIVGDLDSLQHRANWAARTQLLQVDEQDSTDFEKCLSCVRAPYYVALGFCGERLDHTLASLHAVAKRLHTHHVMLLSEEDVIVLSDSRETLHLPLGSRLSVFPLQPLRFAASRGLKYPLDGLRLGIAEMIGTSNEVTAERVEIEPQPGSHGCYALIADRQLRPSFEQLLRRRVNDSGA